MMTNRLRSPFIEGVYMRITRIHEHFPARSAEWGLAFILLSWGLATLFLSTNFENILRFHGDGLLTKFWGGLATATGLARVIALYINGSSRHTPLARMICAALSGFIWVHVVALFIGATTSMSLFPLALVIVPWFVVGDFYASYEAGKDARVASEIKKAKSKRADSDGVSSERSGNRVFHHPI